MAFFYFSMMSFSKSPLYLQTNMMLEHRSKSTIFMAQAGLSRRISGSGEINAGFTQLDST